MFENLGSLPTVGYLGAAILFILSLGGLSSQETSARGNVYGMIGMAIAVSNSRPMGNQPRGPGRNIIRR